MQVKTFFGENLQQAFKQAKAELGEDIILLESKEMPANPLIPGQKRMVQISVALPEAKPKPTPLGGPKVKEWAPERIGAEHEAEAPSPKVQRHNQQNFNEILSKVLPPKKKEEDDEEDRILNEILQLRQDLNQLSRKTQHQVANDFPTPYSGVFAELEEKGVTLELAYSFVRRAYLQLEGSHDAHYENVIDKVKREMGEIFSGFDFAAQNKTNKQQVVMLLGATGVGKSTTAMKLAANPDIYGKKDTAIVSTDPYGPSEPLRAFSKITGITVVEAKTFEEIDAALKDLKNKEVIIVDTPGRSPFAPNHLEKLERYLEVVKPTNIFLVLSMASDVRDLFLSCGMYILLNPSGIIFTKFDETSQPGKVFSVLEEIKLPVAAMCEGKRIFIDIVTGNVEFLFKRIFDEN
jgi:flagellar biosynthesis protein FlhF